jgi:methenyltetrahydrofolate cyclohydrolase
VGTVSFGPLPLEGYLDKLASAEPTPGGGTASAVAGATAAALAEMVLGLTLGKAKFKAAEPALAPLLPRARALRLQFMALADEDSRAYDRFVAALRLPKASDAEQAAREAAMQRAAAHAADVPLRTARAALATLELLGPLLQHGNPNARSDVLVASHHAVVAFEGGRLNVLANVDGLGDAAKAGALRAELESLAKRAEALRGTLR